MADKNWGKNVALIPVRGGSKSIPLKNIRLINGRPLVYWVLLAAQQCAEIDEIFVSTDSEEIASVVNGFGLDKVVTIGRAAETATDTASTESAMLDFAGKYAFDKIVLIQATSPLLTEDDLARGFALLAEPDTDSVISVVNQKRFIWSIDKQGIAHPENYDVFARPRRQEFDGYFVENGAFYITSRARLLESKNRISGNIRAIEMAEESYFELDEPEDWVIIEKLLESRRGPAASGKKVRLFLTDCDGCLTDAGMYYSDDGSEMKKFNTQDGMGFQLLREKGVFTGIITGEENALVARRAQKLCVDELHMGIADKMPVIQRLCDKYGITLDEVAYVGDDVGDVELLRAVGLGCSVKNAHTSARHAAKHKLEKEGGSGAVREAIDLVLRHNSILESDGRL